ncbi:hypothetical protein [Kaistella jeonii]|uniref:Uncharacterized protein n=1 Tax=Kaistella jeonii TaxID=266749 RepID=A0A0C1CFB9_9FLAO|nr:hypothetical protein [Kaistella jeonii]KIA82311.1 hypothetical protein OA86_15095 [Kaistella jeonii]SFC44859.1 hypothetical protein SAMN05421876_1275 [Kaistella jeonii]VEI96519.1 Uncharacterised protein [Kaistella jeonii]
MTKVYSKYKIIGGFGLLLGLNILIGFGTFKLLISSKISYDKVDLINDKNALFAYSVIIGLNLLFLLLLATQSKFVIADNSGITFINPLIPILRNSKQWTDFDYYILVEEHSRYETHEAVWLIKDEKIKGRFSSFYYANYTDLKKQIKTKGLGKKNYGQFVQLFALLGLKRIKN